RPASAIVRPPRPAQENAMIIRSSDQVSRSPIKRFPVPKNFGVAPESRVKRGRTWPAPAGARRVKAFEIYRYDPDSGANPRIDTFHVDLDDCGPMVLRSEEHTSELQSRENLVCRLLLEKKKIERISR